MILKRDRDCDQDSYIEVIKITATTIKATFEYVSIYIENLEATQIKNLRHEEAS